MSDDQTQTLPLRAAYAFGIEKGFEQEVDAIRSMDIEWDLPYTSTLRRGFVVDLLERHGIFDEFKAVHWRNGGTRAGDALVRRFRRIKSQYQNYIAGGEPPIIDEVESDQEFAAEADLRDFLARNPNCIESGLRIYSSEERNGIEFPIEAGRIDILAIDQNNRYLVIELKVGRGRNKTLGQLLYYMGWIDKNLGRGPCRGMIIAKDIPDDLVLAVQRVPGVSLLRYTLSVSVEAVHTSQ